MRRLSLILAMLAIAAFAAGPALAKGKSGGHAHHSSSHSSATHHSSSHSRTGNHPGSAKSSSGAKQKAAKNDQGGNSGAPAKDSSQPAGSTTAAPAAAKGVASRTHSSVTHSGRHHRGYVRSYRHVSHRRNTGRPSFLVGPDQIVAMNSGAHLVAPWAMILSNGSIRQGGRAVHFEVTGNSNSALFVQPPSVSPTGALSFTPAVGQSGTATITLVLRSSGGSSAPQTFQITVKPA
jgi:hypothetical protein